MKTFSQVVLSRIVAHYATWAYTLEEVEGILFKALLQVVVKFPLLE